MIGKNPAEGAGFGASVPEALRGLADALMRNGVWIEVRALWGGK